MTHCDSCGRRLDDGIFARVPHYDTWEEFSAAVWQHPFDDFAAWRKSHAAWIAEHPPAYDWWTDGDRKVSNDDQNDVVEIEHQGTGCGAELH